MLRVFFGAFNLAIEASYQSKVVQFEFRPEFPLCIVPNSEEKPSHVTACWWELYQRSGKLSISALQDWAGIYLKEFHQWYLRT